MALNFRSASSDVSNHGSAASIDDFDPFTHLFWVNWLSSGGSQRMVAKGASPNGHEVSKQGGSGAIGLIVQRATTDTTYITSTFPLVLNTWRFIAATFDSGAGAGEVVNIYSGDLGSVATEESYSTATDGAGALTSEASADLLVGNNSVATRNFEGDIAIYAYVNRALTLGECVSWQFHPRIIPGTRVFTIYGFNGTGAQPDWSGNGNAGTLTGTTQVAHVPLGPPFGFDSSDVFTAAVGGRIMSSLAGAGGLAGMGGIAGQGGGLAA